MARGGLACHLPHRRRRRLLLATLLLVCGGLLGAHQLTQPTPTVLSWSGSPRAQLPRECFPHDLPWRTSIAAFLGAWRDVKPRSLTFAGFVDALAAVPEGHVHIALAVQDGLLYALRPSMPIPDRHPWLTGMLEQLIRAAPALPDAYFVVTTSDWPAAEKAGPPLWSKLLTLGPSASAAHYDIPIPNGAFEPVYEVNGGYDAFLAGSSAAAAKVPWRARSPIAFFRGVMSCAATGEECSQWRRVCARLEAAALSLARPDLLDVGVTGRYLDSYDGCIRARIGMRAVVSRDGVRSIDSAASNKGAVGVASTPTPVSTLAYSLPVPMADHTRFKYLLQMGGNTYSYRLQSLLPLGSTVLAETLPYMEFYVPALLSVGEGETPRVVW